MKRLLSGICCVALCSASAFAAAKTVPAMSDQQFVDFAAQTDMVEANLGQYAQSVAASQKVKDYGQMLVTDHTNDFNKLYTAAQQANLKRPNAIDAKNNKEMIDPLEKLKGADFDHHYIHDMVAGHTKALAMYKKEEADAQSPVIKAYVEDALPTLQKHLDDARAIEK